MRIIGLFRDYFLLKQSKVKKKEGNVKKAIYNHMFITLITCISLMIGVKVGHVQAEKYLYPLATTVTQVDYDADVVTCTDANGHDWLLFGCEDWMKNDICTLLMNDMGTETIYDDEIVKAIYSFDLQEGK